MRVDVPAYIRIWVVGLGVACGLAVSAGPAHADTNPTSIAVPLLGTIGAGSPYPSTINVAARGGTAQTGQVSVMLHAVTHTCPEDLAVLLVHGGTGYLLMANAGSCRPLQGTNVLFRAPSVPLPDSDPVTTPYGAELTIGPSVYGAAPTFPAPAPPGPYVVGLPPASTVINGAWDLYVIDRASLDRGVIAGGWTLHYPTTFTTPATQTNVAIPGTGTEGTAATFPVDFNLSTVPAGVRVTGVVLTLTLSHTFPDDLEIFLQSPSGTSVLVMNDVGGSADLVNVPLVFGDLGAVPPDPGPLVAGNYRPGSLSGSVESPQPPLPHEATFGTLTGQAATGTWRLWIFDDTGGDVGTLVSATLTIDTEFVPPIFHIDTPVSTPTYTSTQPFLQIAGEIEDLISPYSATWRNVVDGTYYASGPMQFPPTGDIIRGNVPLKQGANIITVYVRDTQGFQTTDTLTVTVSEFDYYLTEGATGTFFDMDVSLANPTAAAAPVMLTFLPEAGAPIPHPDSVGANAPLRLSGDDYVSGATATVVRSTSAAPLAVERTMFWDATYYGGHGGTAVDGPATRWLFAEGSQGFFDTFLLLANDNAADVTATVRFLREGGTPVVITPSLPAHSRTTIYAGGVAGLTGTSFGIDVTATSPITAERAMYFPHDGPRVFEGGHGSAGVTETSRTWFLAEGATGTFFECFVLVSNPNATDANVQFTYLLPGGTTVVRNAVVGANARLTVNVEGVDPLLANTPVSTTITSNVGVVVERAMYWPDISLGWQEAHNSFGVPEAGLRWGLADGRVGGSQEFQTYVLLANPNPAPAEVQVRFLRPGVAPVVKAYTVPATSRHNISVGSDVPEIPAGSFGVDVRVLNFQPIAVEKAMYWNSGGVVWAGGSNVTASRLPPP